MESSEQLICTYRREDARQRHDARRSHLIKVILIQFNVPQYALLLMAAKCGSIFPSLQHASLLHLLSVYSYHNQCGSMHVGMQRNQKNDHISFWIRVRENRPWLSKQVIGLKRSKKIIIIEKSQRSKESHCENFHCSIS